MTQYARLDDEVDSFSLRSALSIFVIYTGDMLFGNFNCRKLKGDKRSLDITMEIQHFIGKSTIPSVTRTYCYVIQ